MTARRIPSARKQLVELLGNPAEWDADSLMEALDASAIVSGAFHAFETAEEGRRIAAEERRLAVVAIREAKRAAAQAKAEAREEAKMHKAEDKMLAEPVRETVDEQAARLLPRLYAKAGQLPQVSAGTEALKVWLSMASPMLDVCQVPLRMALANAIYADTIKAGWPADIASGFAQACAGPALQPAA